MILARSLPSKTKRPFQPSPLSPAGCPEGSPKKSVTERKNPPHVPNSTRYMAPKKVQGEIIPVALKVHMDVSKNRGTLKWMVYNGKPYWNGWFGGTIIFGNTHIVQLRHSPFAGFFCWRVALPTVFGASPYPKWVTLYPTNLERKPESDCDGCLICKDAFRLKCGMIIRWDDSRL